MDVSTEALSSVSFAIGECFSSYFDLEEKIKLYESSSAVQLTHRDSRTLEAARRRVPKRVEGANTELKYYSIQLSCVFGGKKYKNKGCLGQRPNQCTLKQGCNAGIRLGLSEDKQCLQVIEVNEDHNHEVNKDIYDHLPRQRRLDEEHVKEAEQLIGMKVNKKLLQQHLSNQTGKVVTLKDISNVQTAIREKSNKNDLDALFDHLKSIKGSSVEVFVDETNTFSGIFFQDHTMKSNFAAYPEIIMVDATYKLNEFRMPLYLLLVIDSNGQSEIVGLYLTNLETEEAITRMVTVFKRENSSWANTKVVMSDKDFTERAVFENEFPSASLLICLFHTLQSMRREVTCEKLGLRPGERDHVLEVLTSLAYSKSEEEYNKHYQILLDSGYKSVNEYYNRNWHPIRHQWVECFKGVNFTMGERTNNRLECINSKIKSVCSKYANLATFFNQFFAVLASLRNERDHATLMAFVKKRVTAYSPSSSEGMFAKLLTPYAFSYVEKQLEMRKNVTILLSENLGQDFTIASSTGNLSVTTESCQRKFWNSMHLPCRHIFAVREQQKLPLYCSAVVSERWTTSYMQEVYGRKTSLCDPDDSFQVSSVRELTTTVLSQHQKFNKARHVTQALTSLASEVGMTKFEGRLSLLKTIRDSWANGKEIVLVLSGEECEDSGQFQSQSTPDHDCDSEEMIVNETDQITEYDGATSSATTDEDNTDCDRDTCSANTWIADESQECTDDFKSIKLPPKIRKRGRPKGAEKTVIGLPRKKNRGVDKPVPFLKKYPTDKEKVMLQWFVDLNIAEKALAGRLIEESEVEVIPERVNTACLDQNVCIKAIQKYFSRDGWDSLLSVMSAVEQNPVWYCGRCTCSISDDNEDSIVCDSCLAWFHFRCVGLKKSPKSRLWFCRSCHASVHLSHKK